MNLIDLDHCLSIRVQSWMKALMAGLGQ
uniref:Uncharacterized protein n=1 Tax=Rhizophora mucronata TaxID=61149 RepID=A0A2P2PDC3_RHIMU